MAIYECSWEVEPGTTRNKFSEWSERVLNPGYPDLKASALTTGPHCKLVQFKKICCRATDFLKSGPHSVRNRHVNQRECEWVMSKNTLKIKVFELADTKRKTGRSFEEKLHVLHNLLGTAVASWLVHSTLKQVVRVRALDGDIVVCSWARHFTLTVPLSIQVYKWVLANLILGVALQWTSIPSRRKQKYS